MSDPWLPLKRAAVTALNELPKLQRAYVLVWYCGCGECLKPGGPEECPQCIADMVG